MNKKVDISVYEVVGSPLCVAADDGQKVYSRIAGALKEKCDVVLSFNNVDILTSAFLNTAVGQLYGEFGEDEIRSSLKVADMEAGDLVLLKRVVDTAKKYFSDPEKFKQAIDEEMEDK